MDKQAFIGRIVALCEPLSLSVPLSVTIAQAALESAWGESGLTKNANALFGIKAGKSWTGKRYTTRTTEVQNGNTISTTADFRAYDSWAESIIDHDDFLRKIPRYEAVCNAKTGYEAADALQAAGYATDPYYAHKLQSIISQYGLSKYDNQEVLENPPMPTQTATTANENTAEKTVEIMAQAGETLHIVVRVLSND